MTVTTTDTPTPREVLAADNRMAIVPSQHSDAVAFLRSWAEGLQIIGSQMAPLIWTDVVPLHHWPLPPGETLKSFSNPRMKHPRESDEDFVRRQQGAAASATAVAMRGSTLGIDPFVALADMWNIRGKLGMSTKLRNAYAKSRGIKTWDEELTPESVTCCGIDPLTGETVRITITMRDAERAKWTENDNYRRNPVDMLWARAMGRVLDRVAGHVLAGIGSIEDLRDAEDASPAAAARPATVTVEDLTSRTAPPVAELADEPADPAPAAPAKSADVPMIDERTWRAINREWTRLGVTGPGSTDRRLGAIVRMVGHPITGGSELTAVEADLVLDTLKGLPVERLDLLAEVLGEAVPEPDGADAPPPAAPAGEEPPGWQE